MSLFHGSVDEDALLYSTFPSIRFIVCHSYRKKELDLRSPLRFSIFSEQIHKTYHNKTYHIRLHPGTLPYHLLAQRVLPA